MDRMDFINEVAVSGNYEQFSDAYNKFIVFQDAALKALREFHNICQKNGIKYQLAFGSLIGAIRDNGYVPWDYDVDVIVDYRDKDKIEQALTKDGGKSFYCISPNVDKKYYLYMMRFCPIEFDSECAHVDVFYLIGSPANIKEKEKVTNRIITLFNDRHRKLLKFTDLYPPINAKSVLWLTVAKIKRILKTNNHIRKKIEQYASKYPINSSDDCIIIYEGRYGALYKRSWFENTIVIETSVGKVCVPKDYTEVLKRFYKSYYIYPSIESRVNEVYHYLSILQKFQDKYDKEKNGQKS